MGSHFETGRLWLCEWSLDDLEESRPIFTDPDVMRYISGGIPRSDDQIREFIARQQNHFRGCGFCLWKLLFKPESRFVACVVCSRSSWMALRKLKLAGGL